MATWLTHIRVADIVNQRFYYAQNVALYFAGSVAPDNGYGADISHWCVNSDKSTCDIKLFYLEHILNKQPNTFDFYAGYYVHLYTDMIWQKQMIAPLILKDNDIKIAKQKWRTADAEFLYENEGFKPIADLVMAKGLDVKWFDFFDDQIVKTLVDKTIRLGGEHPPAKADPDARNDIDSFINTCADTIINNWGVK